MSECLPLSAFASEHEFGVVRVPSPLGVLCAEVSVMPSLTVVLVDSLTLALGGYVPVLTRPQRAEWSRL